MSSAVNVVHVSIDEATSDDADGVHGAPVDVRRAWVLANGTYSTESVTDADEDCCSMFAHRHCQHNGCRFSPSSLSSSCNDGFETRSSLA